MSTRAVGEAAETAALEYLQGQGLRCVERNYRTRRGELDLVMRDGQELVFVEVRFRRSARFGDSSASITAAKQRRLQQAAEHYRLTHPAEQRRRCRFDVVAVDGVGTAAQVRWLRGAF